MLRNASASEEIEELTACIELVRSKIEGERKLLLIAVYEDGHYVLLALEFEKAKLTRVRYVDSLTSLNTRCKARASWILSLFTDERLPDRCNSVFQKKGSMRCGIFCLAYMEIIANEFLGAGPASCGHPELLRQLDLFI